LSTADIIAIVISALSALAAIFLAAITWRTMNLNKRLAESALKLNEHIFHRQNIISLHVYWDSVQMIDTANPYFRDIVKAVNALDLTASLWNHGGIEKEILYNSYWESYQQLYDAFNNMNTAIPGIGRTPRSLLTPTITSAYQGMLQYGISKVAQTSLNP